MIASHLLPSHRRPSLAPAPSPSSPLHIIASRLLLATPSPSLTRCTSSPPGFPSEKRALLVKIGTLGVTLIQQTEETSFSGQEDNEHNEILDWAKTNNHGSLEIICEYNRLCVPARGSTIKFHPLEHLHPLEFYRPDETVLHIAGSTVDLMSCSTSFELAEAHMALAAEEEATALSAWVISCICGSMRLEHVIVLLDMNKLPAGTSFYGTGEVSGQLERTGKRVFTWNTDAWGYGTGTTSLYQSHPWVLAVIPNGEALGILANTTKRCEIDLRKELTAKLIAPLPFPVVTFGLFASATDVLTSLSHAIGTVFMPPKWSLGYQQCRWFEIHLFGLTILFNSLTIQGLSGQPLSGPDIGGFAGNATPKLFARWLGVGAMFPFCRGHSEKGTIDHEPWSFEEEILRIAV